MKSVQGDSGHSSVDMIAKVYSHIIDEDRRVNASTFNEQFYSTKAFSESSGIREIAKPDFSVKKDNVPVLEISKSGRGLDEEIKDHEDETAELVAKLIKNPDAINLLKRILK